MQQIGIYFGDHVTFNNRLSIHFSSESINIKPKLSYWYEILL